jgi:hypothetical protein
MITCSTCRTSKPDDEYDVGRRQCRRCRTAKVIEWQKAHPRNQRETQARANRSVTGRHSQLLYSAKERDVRCDIRVDEYEEIIRDGTCFYCGDAISETGHSLAMINPARGYVVGNVVPSCPRCNALRGLTHDEKIRRKNAKRRDWRG